METERKTIYSASAWWIDCDPFVGVISTSRQAVEKAIEDAIDSEAQDAFDSSEPEDERTKDDYASEIAWSGIHELSEDDIADISPREYDEDLPKVLAGDDDAVSYWQGM